MGSRFLSLPPTCSTLVLLGKPEQTQHTRHPDLLGQQTRAQPCSWSGQCPVQGRCPRCTPISQVQGPSPAQLCSPLSLSLPVPDLMGACMTLGFLFGSFFSLCGPALFT